MADDSKSPTVPYVPFRTFLNLLDKLHSGGIPQHIDRHYWGAFLAGSTGQQVMAALRFFGLINPETNEATPALERLVDPIERKQLLKELLTDRYAALTTEQRVDLTRATPGHLERAFAAQYKVEGETKRKAVTFYVHAAKFAEIPLSPSITNKTRQRRSPSTSTSRSRAKTPSPTLPRGKEEGVQSGNQQTPTPPGGGQFAILHALLDYLPAEGQWTSERRQQWLAALQANVDFLVSVREDEESDFDDYLDAEDDA